MRTVALHVPGTNTYLADGYLDAQRHQRGHVSERVSRELDQREPEWQLQREQFGQQQREQVQRVELRQQQRLRLLRTSITVPGDLRSDDQTRPGGFSL